jgi:cytochrome c-type biogenesis protein CcmH/NrfG
MLSGAPPFTGLNGVAVMQRHLEEAPPELRDVSPEIPSELSGLVSQLLVKLPSRRLSSGRELAARLQHWLMRSGPAQTGAVPVVVDLPLTVSQQAPSREVMPTGEVPFAETVVAADSKPSRRRTLPRLVISVALVLILASIAVGVWRYWIGGPKEPEAQYSIYQRNLPAMAGMPQEQRTAFLEALLRQHPGDRSVTTALAEIYYRAGTYDRARECYESVLSQEPDNLEARSDLASTLFQLRQFDEAIQQLHEVLKSNSTHAKSLLNLGIMMQTCKGDRNAASRYWNQLVESNPQSPYAAQARILLGSSAP